MKTPSLKPSPIWTGPLVWMPGVLLLLLALGASVAPAGAEDVAKQPKAPAARVVAKRALRALSIGEARKVGPLQVVLLDVSNGYVQSQVRAASTVKDLTFREPTVLEDPTHEDVVALHPGAQTLFLPGGSVLLGGRVDRIAREDVILSAQASATLVEALPASLGKARQADLPLRLVPAWADDQVRRHAAFGGDAAGIVAYLERFGGLTPKIASSLSLLDVRRGQKAQAVLKGIDEEARALRESITPQTVGYVAWHDGQLQSFEIFGSSELLRVHVTAAVRATASKAAIVARYPSVLGLAALPPKGPLPDGWARLYTRNLLSRVRISAKTDEIARPAGTLGRPLRVVLKGYLGRALVLEHDLVHLSIFADDPREAQLFVPVAAPTPPTGSTAGGTSGTGTTNGTGDAGQAELDRRAERGTLTEAEKRRRERLRGGGGATPPDRTPNPPRVPTPPRTPAPPRSPAPPGGGGTPPPPGIGR